MKKRIESFSHAFRGVVDFIRIGTNAKIQSLCAVLVSVAGLVFGFSANEWLAVCICIGLVLSAEAMNTAIEQLADEVTEERRERIRRAKDMAAGSVLIASITSLVVALIILLPKL